MLENFIYAKQKSLFEEKLNNGEVLDEAIVFIEDTREIWNHGTYFDGNAVDLSDVEKSIEQQLVWEKAEGEAGIRLKGTNGTATGASSISAGDDKIASNGTEYKSVASGDHAVAFGYGNTCSGRTTLAQGLYNIVTGKDCVAFGQKNTVGGQQAFAVGMANEITAPRNGIALGYGNKVTVQNGVALGWGNVASGDAAIAMGDACEASATSAVAMGYQTKAGGSASVTFGKFTKTTDAGEVAMGLYNKSTTSTNTAEQTSFSFGIGTSDTNRINAFEIKKNGDVYIGDKLLSNVATSGSYNDLTNKPTIPSAVTESTVSGWGFTKNTGTITGVSANGTSVATSGVANIPAASTSAYGVTKLSSSISSTSTTLAATASSVKAAYDLANGKQEKLVSGTNIKTINGESILGEGNIVINSSSSEETTIDNGVYAVTADEKLIDYNEADESCIGVALVAGEHKFMIAKSDATNDGSNYNLYYDYDKGDLSLTDYNTADGTNSNGSLGTKLSDDFTTWTEGALSDFNGKTNTQVIAASSSNAKDMCKVLETFNAGSDNQGHTDWYVPACGQLAHMYLAKTDINAALAKIGGTAFESYYYWSSSEYAAKHAWRVAFNDGGVLYNGKSGNHRVRFVRDISVKSLKERVSDLESKIKDLNTSGSSNGAYAEINHGTNDTTFTLTPNTFHVWDEVASLDLSFADEQSGVANEYLFQFTSGATATTLTLPDVKWAEELVVASNAVYQVSVLKGLGVWVEF